MKSKLVIWGKGPTEKRVLIGISLDEKANKVESFIFDEDLVTEELENQLNNDWRNGEEIALPAGVVHLKNELSLVDSLLPEGYSTDKEDVLKRAQTEWHFIVLSSRLYEMYKNEVVELREKIDAAEAYSQDLWENLREFWDKVQSQIHNKNLLRSHSAELKDFTNKLFDLLKDKRKALDVVVNEKSKMAMDILSSKMDEVEDKIEKGLSLHVLFDDLKKIQKDINNFDLLRDHRNKIWNRIDAAFKIVKEKRFGDSSQTVDQKVRLENRLKGLNTVIQKMQKSIKRDEKETEERRPVSDNPFGILEEQLREARIKMTKERINSKQNKLDDMLKTREELQNKLERLVAREEKQKLVEEAKKLAEQKIAEEIKVNTELRKDDEDKLIKAAEDLKSDDKTKGKKVRQNAPANEAEQTANKEKATPEIAATPIVLPESLEISVASEEE
jgi:hypothetical protein